MTRLFAIARNACLETIRQPIFGILILITFGVLVLDVPLTGWSMGRGLAEYAETDQQMLVNMGLSTLLAAGLFIAAFSAAGVLSREIEDRTILTVVSKPVPRWLVVLGKYLGVSAGLLAAYLLCAIVFLMTVRHKVTSTAADPIDYPVIVLGAGSFALAVLSALIVNYSFGWNFASAATGFALLLMGLAMGAIVFVGKGWKLIPYSPEITPELLKATLLLFLGVLVFAAVAVAASTRLGQLMTLLACFGFFTVGSMSQYLFGQFSGKLWAARAAYAAWPNLSVYYALDAMLSSPPRPIPLGYVGLAGLYALCNIVAILAVGMALFQRRELEAQDSASAPRLVTVVAWLGRVVAVGVGLAALIVPSFHAPVKGVALAILLGAGAAASWVFWGWFGRGVKWTYVLLLLISAGSLALYAADFVSPKDLTGLGDRLLIADGVASATVLLILMLPKSRHHFGFVPKARKHQPILPG